MDEFFDFEDAARPRSPAARDSFERASVAPFDLDLSFAPGDDQLGFKLPRDTAMMGPDDFTDFPRWIDGMDVPSNPCEDCHRMRTHCKVLKEGTRKGSCTSCVALAKTCSLASDLNPHIDRFPVAMTEDHDGDEAGRRITWTTPAAKTSRALDRFPHNGSASDWTALRSSIESLAEQGENGPKVGARFSREAVRILRTWLSTHHHHPYPSDEEKESLQRQTGLSKTQITNWLANARRRGKVRAPRSTSPSPHQLANGMDIPRRGTPAMQEMNPLERWKHSPPEHEPASVTAIAKAVSTSTFSSGLDSPLTSYGHTDDGSGRSLCNVSSTSSLGTSHSSGGSFASAFSHKSRGSFGSFNSFGNRGRRRRRRQAPKPSSPSALTAAPRTYQCTFCTETFKTKHDWQRHEKSLHLSLERWVCSPNGPATFAAEWNHVACVFCGLPNPPEGHAEQHNYTSCAERSLEERTFYRKDHLRQHLNLVHNVKFQGWSMDSWKVATPEIRSRCGFCGIVMDSWSIRVEHLAEHFKGGKSMADWKGDWGFEAQVLGIVENGMPPYLIHDERNTLNPYQASKEDPSLERSLEDKVKMGLVECINEMVLAGSTPTDDDLLAEAINIVRKDEATDGSCYGPDASWFRDLIMLSGAAGADTREPFHVGTLPHVSWAEKLEMINIQNPTNRDLSIIKCPKERDLIEYVVSRQMLGLTPTDSELQAQASKILEDLEPTSSCKCKGAVQWFKFLITSAPNWLAEFRRRAGLPRSSEMAVEHIRSSDDRTIDYGIHNAYRLEKELNDFVQLQRAAGLTPTDADIQRQARLIIYASDDPWNQTVIDDTRNLYNFKVQNGLVPLDVGGVPNLSGMGEGTVSRGSGSVQPHSSPRTLHWDLEDSGVGLPSPLSGTDLPGPPSASQPLHTLVQNQPSTNTNPTQPLKYFLNDANCYGRLAKELGRFVTSCLSPNNPLQHVPSDAEIQNQARWVIYDDDDPWNQTAADNAEWLIRFKRDVGLAPVADGPGLPPFTTVPQPWAVKDGGTGFLPPYVKPKAGQVPPFAEDVPVAMDHLTYNVCRETAGKYVRDLDSGRYQAPATVFCSRELEDGLSAFVRGRGGMPSDDELRIKAREILGVATTAADDAELLARFKAMHALSTGGLPDFNVHNLAGETNLFADCNLPVGDMNLGDFPGVGDLDVGMDGEFVGFHAELCRASQQMAERERFAGA